MKTRIQKVFIVHALLTTLYLTSNSAANAQTDGPRLSRLPPLASGEPVYINFDDVATPSGAVDATAYLASFGITIANVTHDGTPATGSVYIENDTNFYGGGAVFATSGHNFLIQQASGISESYTLVLARPLQSLSFTRCAVSSGAAAPSWTATAYAGSDPVDSVAVCCLDSDTGQPARVYTLNGPGITSIMITANPANFAALGSAPMDDFYLVPQSIPDLQVIDLAAIKNREPEGTKVTITATILNAGNADAGASVTAFLDGPALIDLVATPALPVGMGISVSIDWFIPAKNGQHMISAMANARDLVSERYYRNNSRAIMVNVPCDQIK